MAVPLHLLKLCVGCDSIDSLADWQAHRADEARRAGTDPRPIHVTRMWPKREAELRDGGSLYWVIKGLVLVRQRVVGLDRQRGDDGIERCAIRLDPELVRTVPQRRRAFQGWRYLEPADAPRDIGRGSLPADLPPELAAGLALVGVL